MTMSTFNRRNVLQAGGALTALTVMNQFAAFAQSAMPFEQVKVLYGFPPGSAGERLLARLEQARGLPSRSW